MDRGEFLQHFMEIDRPLRSYLMGATASVHDVDDLLQNVWKVLWEKLDEYDSNRPFKAWAMGVARLEALKWRQSKARSKEVLSEEVLGLLADTVEVEAEEIHVRHAFLLDCIQQLEALPRRVLQFKYLKGLASREIAGKVGKSVPAVEMMLVRIRRALRVCIEAKLAEANLTP